MLQEDDLAWNVLGLFEARLHRGKVKHYNFTAVACDCQVAGGLTFESHVDKLVHFFVMVVGETEICVALETLHQLKVFLGVVERNVSVSVAHNQCLEVFAECKASGASPLLRPQRLDF